MFIITIQEQEFKNYDLFTITKVDDPLKSSNSNIVLQNRIFYGSLLSIEYDEKLPHTKLHKTFRVPNQYIVVLSKVIELVNLEITQHQMFFADPYKEGFQCFREIIFQINS